MLSAKQVEPGQTGEIEVSVRTEELPASVLNKTITVSSNDPQNRQIVLNLTATVQPEFVRSERTIFFGNVPSGKEETRSIAITIAADRAVKLTSVESTDSNFTARLDPADGSDGKKITLVCTMKSDAKEGYHFGMLVVRTSSAFTPEFKIPVRGTVTAPQNE